MTYFHIDELKRKLEIINQVVLEVMGRVGSVYKMATVLFMKEGGVSFDN